MSHRARWIPLAGAVLLLGRLLACSSSSDGGNASAGGGNACMIGPFDGVHCCTPNSTCRLDTYTCNGNDYLVPTVACDPTTWTCPKGPVTMTAYPCPAETVCNAGSCLTGLAPPTMPCHAASDCALPDSACFGLDHVMSYSDPTCDLGQCHYKQTIYECTGPTGCVDNGQCMYAVAYMTAGSVTYDPQLPLPPASVPPTQACTQPGDCTPPPPSCFDEFVVTYASPACQAGACAWEMTLTPCHVTCFHGACAEAQCQADADCTPWPPTCEEQDPEDGIGWFVESCPSPQCKSGTCTCASPTKVSCPGDCYDGGCGGGPPSGAGGSGP